MEYRFSDKIASLKPSAIREVLKATSVPGMIPFAAGNPAPDAFPRQIRWRAVIPAHAITRSTIRSTLTTEITRQTTHADTAYAQEKKS